MVRPIPSAREARTYRLAGDGNLKRGGATLSGALRAFSDDLIETGDPRLALERAFRWGYRQENGDHVAGLQEQLQDLRQQRERLRRQVEDASFLDALEPELDHLDEMDGEEPADGSALDRLADRLDRGYGDPDAQARFDDMVASLRAMSGQPGSEEEREQQTEPAQASFFQSLTGSRQARLDRVRQMLLRGGVDADGQGAGTWRVGDEDRRRSLTLDLETLSRLDEMDQALARLQSVGSVMELADADLARLADVLPDDARDWLAGWAEAAEALRRHREARDASGRASLPPEVISAIGRDLLRNLFRRVAAPASGEHETVLSGNAGDAAETSGPWEPGRPLDLNLIGTLTNAIRRGGQVERGRVRLRPDDFEVVERTARTAVSTVLAIDRSRSMGQSGAWAAAKTVTLAMHGLIRQSYPRDSLSVEAFSNTAEAVAVDALPEMQWDRFEHGTNLQAALELGRRILQGSPAGTRQIVVITDGEPTIALVRGELVFASPPTPEVLEATMREVIRCTRERILINMVILGGEAGVATFAEQVARVNKGRIFVADNRNLGTFILRDYITR